MKPGQPKRFRRGNLAFTDFKIPPTIPNCDFVVTWDRPPCEKQPNTIGKIKSGELVLVAQVFNFNQHTQFSFIFLSKTGETGWINSKFLRKIQK